MKETEMGYRGSKSEIKRPQVYELSVKEQRVDGSWFLAKKARSLRYTLMGFERSYQVRFLSNQINKLSLHALDLSPYFVTGIPRGVTLSLVSKFLRCKFIAQVF